MDSGFTYLVVADDACGRQLPFQFLEKVKGIFAQKFAGSVGENANAHSLDRTFGPTLKKEMEETMALEQLSGEKGAAARRTALSGIRKSLRAATSQRGKGNHDG